MTRDNAVIFKGGKNGIIILLDEAATFEQICNSLRRKIRDASKFFAGAQTSISFKGKLVSEAEILNLLEIINEETDLSITFVEDLTGELPVSPSEASPQSPTNEEKTQEPKDTVYFHKNSLRSGQAIVQKGSVIILGDVNAGAQVTATGNVVVFGAMRGFVHAGSEGDESAFVVALSLQPIQLRIAEKIVHFPQERPSDRNKINPAYAFIMNDAIHVAPVAN
jgi:septum site-determining protein MinC